MIHPVPKPAKREKKKDAIVNRGTREICRGAAWEERRKEVNARAGGICERKLCRRPAPLHDIRDHHSGAVIIKAGHAHHKRKRGMGGGFRDDSLKNLEWLCADCHHEEHRPRRRSHKADLIGGHLG